MGYSVRLSSILLLFTLFVAGPQLYAQSNLPSHEAAVQLEHQDPQWPLIASHLPDPATTSSERLEMIADVLRARRFPESALDYYVYALKRGGEEAQLLNKMGVTELEIGNNRLARAYFQRVVHLNQKSADGWNNLGAVQYLEGQNGNAISSYKRAIKLNKKSASFHSNLGTVYFQTNDFKRARKEFATALALDPGLMVHGGGPGGVTMRMLSPEDHARFSYEMARIYAQAQNEAEMLRYLTRASEAGFDVLDAMGRDDVLKQYRKDPRVLLLVHNAQALRSGQLPGTVSNASLQPLAPLANK